MIVELAFKSKWLANWKEVLEIVTPRMRLRIIICLAEIEKIRAIVAGKISSAVIKNMPTICTQTATVSDSKIKKDKFQTSVLMPEILAKSLFSFISKIFFKAKML